MDFLFLYLACVVAGLQLASVLLTLSIGSARRNPGIEVFGWKSVLIVLRRLRLLCGSVLAAVAVAACVYYAGTSGLAYLWRLAAHLWHARL